MSDSTHPQTNLNPDQLLRVNRWRRRWDARSWSYHHAVDGSDQSFALNGAAEDFADAVAWHWYTVGRVGRSLEPGRRVRDAAGNLALTRRTWGER